MPGVEPASFKSRSGFVEEPVYECSWMDVPFDDYEGMTQQQFQDSIAPFSNHGKNVPITVPKGWRRVEASFPGKHFYVHMSTGAITRNPKELFDCKKECWITKDGTPIPEAEIARDPLERGMSMLYPPKTAPAAAVVPAAPKEVKKLAAEPAAKAVEEVPAIEAAPEAEMDIDVPSLPSEPPLPVALLFPGQGSQYVKMLQNVKDMPAVKSMLAKANEILGYDLLELCMKGPDSKLEQTAYCQPAMYVAGLAAVEKLREQKPERVERIQAVAGLSLGEYTALTVAGVFDFETGLKLVKLRGQAMGEAAEATEQLMLSVAGLEQETLTGLCKDACESPDDICQVANFLFPNGFTCAGSAAAVNRLHAAATGTAGCMQAKLLKTGGAFHTPLMKPAETKLLEALRGLEKDMKPPRCDVYMNVTGKRITPATKPSDIIPLLGEQLCNCVLWTTCMEEMIKDGVTEFYECGPMKQLKAMMKRINPDAFKSTTSIDV